jgi:hypothetical protein
MPSHKLFNPAPPEAMLTPDSFFLQLSKVVSKMGFWGPPDNLVKNIESSSISFA